MWIAPDLNSSFSELRCGPEGNDLREIPEGTEEELKNFLLLDFLTLEDSEVLKCEKDLSQRLSQYSTV
jgi:hypothetical protein